MKGTKGKLILIGIAILLMILYYSGPKKDSVVKYSPSVITERSGATSWIFEKEALLILKMIRILFMM